MCYFFVRRLFAISFYITIRFDKKYALFALLALFHDLLIVFGIFSWLGIILSVEGNSLFAVSLLTIAGFSVNDTVVIFDRIRENLILSNKVIKKLFNYQLMNLLGEQLLLVLPPNSFINYNFVWFLFTILVFVSLSLGIIVGSYSSILLAPSFLLKD
ncbi:MAG: hypothetical protein Ct9H90mP3_6700 [Flammeovirgaceae bacterium]|nr:MAG: hypothetical protein Ct9H90mP3_6700 [Flammeovirgaceae bacterium]